MAFLGITKNALDLKAAVDTNSEPFNVIMCKQKVAEVLNLAAGAALTSIVDGCGFVVYNTNFVPGTLNADIANINDVTAITLVCGACKPGYKPTRDATSKLINACTKIPECNISHKNNTLFNECRVCLNGY